jgi:hypothetical protein
VIHQALLARAKRVLDSPSTDDEVSPERVMIRELVAAIEAETAGPNDVMVRLGPASLPAVLYASTHGGIVNVSHEDAAGSEWLGQHLNRLQARIAVVVLEHTVEVLRAVHNID